MYNLFCLNLIKRHSIWKFYFVSAFPTEKQKNSSSTEKEGSEGKARGGSSTAEGSDTLDISLVEAVDTLIMLYFFGVHRQFSKVIGIYRVSITTVIWSDCIEKD